MLQRYKQNTCKKCNSHITWASLTLKFQVFSAPGSSPCIHLLLWPKAFPQISENPQGKEEREGKLCSQNSSTFQASASSCLLSVLPWLMPVFHSAAEFFKYCKPHKTCMNIDVIKIPRARRDREWILHSNTLTFLHLLGVSIFFPPSPD